MWGNQVTDLWQEDYDSYSFLKEMDDFKEYYDILKDTCYTPDMTILNRKPFHLVFLYDKYKSDFPSYPNIQKRGAVRIAGGFTSLKNFEMMEYQAQPNSVSTPVAFYKTTSSGGGRLQGDLMAMSPASISYMDYFQENGKAMQRVLTAIRFHNPFNSSQQLSVKAFLYVGKRNHWEKESLHPMQRYHLHSNKNDLFFSYKGNKEDRVKV